MKKWIVLCLVIFTACREKYVAGVKDNPGNLVVEGFINTGGPTTINLSRVRKLFDAVPAPETKAKVTIQGETGFAFQLTESAPGEYTGSPVLPLNTNYRLRIITASGREYLSEYTNAKTTSPIDSLTWRRNDAGLEFRIYANGGPSQEKYWYWKSEETYEYHAQYYPRVKWEYDASQTVFNIAWYDPLTQAANTSMFTCWRADYSNAIMVADNSRLTSNPVDRSLLLIPARSVKLSVLYSLNVKQYAVGKKAHDFFDNLRKNTELIGGIFDAQPSELSGNISCITDPAELVIGFVEVTQERQQRIFVKSTDVQGWNYQPDCAPIRVTIGADGKRNDLYGYDTTFRPVDGLPADFVLKKPGYTNIAPGPCVDCRLAGGTTKKPSFWP